MNKGKNRKIVYSVLASCAMLALCMGIVITKVPLGQDGNMLLQAKVEKEDLSKEKEMLKTEIYINKGEMLKDFAINAEVRKIDAQVINVDLRFAIEATLPSDFEENYSVVGIHVKGDNSKKYDVLQNYEFRYKNKAETRTITLGVGFKDKKPIRDYHFLEVAKKSKIGEVELEITQYEDSYLVIFSYKDVNYDIETNGITQEELVEFLTSLISNSKSYEQMVK